MGDIIWLFEDIKMGGSVGLSYILTFGVHYVGHVANSVIKL